MSSDCFKWGLIDDKLLQILGAPLLAPERHSACDLGARFPWFKKYKNNISLLHLYLVIIKLWHWISFKIGTNHVYFFESVRLSSVRESNFWECLWIQAMQCWAARQVWFSRQRGKLKRLPASHSPRSPTHTIPDSLNPFASFTQLAISHHFWTPASPFCFPPLTFPSPWVLSQAWLQASRTIHQQQQLPQWRPPNPSTHSTSASKSPLEFTSLKFSCQLDHLDCVHLSFKSSLAGWPDQCASGCLGIVNINIKAKRFICSDCNCEKMWWNLSQGGCEHQISWHWTLKVQHWANIFLARLALRLMD